PAVASSYTQVRAVLRSRPNQMARYRTAVNRLRSRRRPHHLDLPHMRRDGGRAAAEYPPHDARRAGGGADLNRTRLTSRRRRTTHGDGGADSASMIADANRYASPR